MKVKTVIESDTSSLITTIYSEDEKIVIELSHISNKLILSSDAARALADALFSRVRDLESEIFGRGQMPCQERINIDCDVS